MLERTIAPGRSAQQKLGPEAPVAEATALGATGTGAALLEIATMANLGQLDDETTRPRRDVANGFRGGGSSSDKRGVGHGSDGAPRPQ